jgi:alpha-tubulin suppressor-like RCC1 family protein
VDVKPKYIACGVNHTVVLMTDGSLYGTGRNQLGQLTRTGNKSSLTSISDGVSYIADMMDYPDIHNYTVYFMKSF